MNITFHIGVAAAGLILGLAGQGHTSQANVLRGVGSTRSANQNVLSQPPTRPLMQQLASPTAQAPQGQSDTPNTRLTSSSTEPKESLSQLTLFLFASGLALFIALLGWSDQIRGISRDIREVEHRFLKDIGIDERDFLRIVRPESADEQLEAFTQAANDAQIKTKASAEILDTFAAYTSQRSGIELLHAWKYNLTMTLAISLFVAGIASLFTTATEQVRLVGSMRAEMVLLILPMALIGLLLIIIIFSVRREKAFFLMQLPSSRAIREGEEVVTPKKLRPGVSNRVARRKKKLPPDSSIEGRAAPRKAPSDARETLGRFYAEIFLQLMHGMIRAASVEPDLAKIKEATKSLTKNEMRRISDLAGAYYAEHANPSPKGFSKEQVENLKREALEFAFKAGK